MRAAGLARTRPHGAPLRPFRGNASTVLRLVISFGVANAFAPARVAEAAPVWDASVLLQTSAAGATSGGSGRREAGDADPKTFLDELFGEEKVEESQASTVVSKWRQELENFEDTQYIANFTIGGQVISGIIDTGSFELVVFEANCRGCGRAANYAAALSKTNTKGHLNRGLFYGSGDIYATEAFDEVAMGPFPAINQSFWQAYEATMSVLQVARFQSIVGIGPAQMPHAEAWDEIAAAVKDIKETVDSGKRPVKYQEDRVKTRMDFFKEVSRTPTMVDTFHVTAFSMCLLNEPGARGYFVWNDTLPEEQPSLFTQVRVIGRHTWTVNMSNVVLEPRSSSTKSVALACREGCGAIVDSGTALIMMPEDTVRVLQKHLESLGGACDNLDDLPDLAFRLDDQLFYLPPDSYIAEVDDVPQSMAEYARVRTLDIDGSGKCKLSVMESYSETHWGPLWILGMPFLRKYYTTFHMGRSRAERSLFVTPASPDCTPGEAEATEASLVRQTKGRKNRVVYRRHFRAANMYTSPLAAKAMKRGSVLDL